MLNSSGNYASAQVPHLVIDREVYAWLISEDILSSKVRFPEVGARKVELDDHTTKRFDSGQAIQKLLETAFAAQVKEFFQKNSLLVSRSQNGSTRSYNWKLISQCLNESLRIAIDDSVISRIVAGDIQFVSEILKDLYSKKREKSEKNTMNSPDTMSHVDLSDIHSAFEGNSTILSQHHTLASNRRISLLDEGILKKKLYKREKVLRALAKTQLQPVNLEKLDVARDLSQVLHGLEFIILSVASAFQIDAKKAAVLLGEHNKTWGRLTIKGFQGSFEQVTNWYTHLMQYSRKLVDLCLFDKSDENLFHVLSLLKPGIVSKDFGVAGLACKLITKIAEEISDRGKKDKLYEWLNMPGYGLVSSWLKALQRHPEHCGDLVVLLLAVSGSKSHFETFTIEEMLSLKDSGDEEEYFRVMHLIFGQLASQPKTQWLLAKEENRNELLNSIFNVLRLQSNKTNPKSILKGAAIKLMIDLVKAYPGDILENEDARKEMMVALKGCFGMSANSPTVFLVEVSQQCFELLGFLRGKFTEVYQEVAMSLYNFMGFLLVKVGNSTLRQFILELFLCHLKEFPLKSTKFLFEYFEKAMETIEGMKFTLTLMDLEYLILMAEMEASNSVKNIVPMLKVLIRVNLNNVVFGKIIFERVSLLISKHQSDPSMMEYITDLVKKGLGLYYNSERKRRPYDKEDIYKYLKENLIDNESAPFGFIKPLDQLAIQKEKEEESAALKKKTKKLSHLGTSRSVTSLKIKHVTKPKYSQHELEVERIQRHKRGLIIEFVKMLLNLRNKKVNAFVRDFIIYTNLLLKRAQLENPDVIEAKNSFAMLALLKVFGNPEKVIRDHEDDAEFRVLKGDSIDWNSSEGANVRSSTLLENPSTQSQGQLKPGRKGKNTMLNSLILSKVESVSLVIGKDKIYKRAMKKGVEADPKITKKLKEIRADFLQNEENKRMKAIEEEKRVMDQREVLKKMIELRNIELGVPTRGEDLEKAFVQNFGTIPDYENEKRKALNGLVYRVFDLEGEEDTVAKALRVMLDNFRPAVKQVFEKLSKQSIKQVSDNFEQMQHDSLFIHRKQILQFVNDHNLDTYITKSQLYSLVRDVKVEIMGDQIEVMTLNYEGFVQLLLNLACFIFSQPKFGMGHLPPSYLLYMFIEHLKKVWAAEGYSTLIFTEPEAINYIDPEVILYINKKLQKNKKYQIPKMLEKYTEKTIQFYYGMPGAFKLPPGMKEAYDMLDDIIYNTWEFHILPLRHKFKEITKVRPKPIDPVKHRKEAELHKPKFEDEEEALEAAKKKLDQKLNKERIVDYNKIDLEVLVKGLPMQTRVRLANFELDQRGIAIETALCMEKIFSAVLFTFKHPDKPAPKLNLSSIHIVTSGENKAVKRRAQRETKAELERQEMNKRVEARKEELIAMKPEIDQYKQSKKSKELENALEQTRKLKEKESSRLDRLKKYWDPKIEKVTEKKEEQKQEKQDEEKRKKEKAKEEKINKKEKFEEFLESEMKKNIEKAKKVKEKLEKARFKEENEDHIKWDEKELSLVKKVIEKDKEKLEKAKEFNQKLETFYKSPQIQTAMNKYKLQLQMLFNHYVKQQFVDISKPQNTNELLLDGLLKMGSQMGFIPFIVYPRDLNSLYKRMTRFKEFKDGIGPGLSFDEFMLLVLRIVVQKNKYFENVSENYQRALKNNKKKELEAEETKEEKEQAENEKREAEKLEKQRNEGTDEEAEQGKEKEEEQELMLTTQESIDGLFLMLRLPKTYQEMKTRLIHNQTGNAKLIPNRLKKLSTIYEKEVEPKLIKNHLSITEMN